jgi:hypothetical protein
LATSPYINHFIQPDTIIPNPADPQNWNRYSYVGNNPIRSSDPTGHKACGSIDGNGNCDDTEEKVFKLLDYVDDHILNDRKEGLKGKQRDDVLGAMTKVVNKAAAIFGKDWNGFLDVTTYVFTGYYGHGHETMAAAGFPGVFTDGFVGYFDGASGFHSDFVDKSNQVRHFWAAFATAADPYGDNPAGVIMAQIGNFEHDVIEDWLGFKDTTIMDYELSITGIDIASQVGKGKEIQSPSDLAAVLLYRLGGNGPGYIGAPINPGAWRSPLE